MKIDITCHPPTDIFQDRAKHRWASIVLLALAGCGVLLMVYGMLSRVPLGKALENLALALLGGSAVVFTYYGNKLNEYKGLSESQKQNLENLGRKYTEVATYCQLVAQQDRSPIHVEYEACVEWDENVTHQMEQAG